MKAKVGLLNQKLNVIEKKKKIENSRIIFYISIYRIVFYYIYTIYFF